MREATDDFADAGGTPPQTRLRLPTAGGGRWRAEQSGRDDAGSLTLGPAYSRVADEDKANDFLARTPHLATALNGLAAFLAEKHNVTEISIEYVPEDYDERESLEIFPGFHAKDAAELVDLHGEVLDGFFSRLEWTVADGIIFSIRPGQA